MTLAWGKSTIFRQTDTHLKFSNLLYNHERVLVMFGVYAAYLASPPLLEEFSQFQGCSQQPQNQMQEDNG